MTKNLNAKQFIKQYPKELHPIAEKKMKCCDIISSEWLKKLEKTLKSPILHIPKNFSKSIEDLVDGNGKLLPNLVRGTDYDLVTCFMFDNLSQFTYKNNSEIPREIRCGFGLDPKSGEEVVVFDLVSFNIKLIQCNKRSSSNSRTKSNTAVEKFFASSSWTFQDLLKQFCESLNFDESLHRFYQDSALEEPIKLSLPISSHFRGSTKRSAAYDLYFGPSQKSVTNKSMNKESKVNHSSFANNKVQSTSLNEKESVNTNTKISINNEKSKLKIADFEEQIKTEKIKTEIAPTSNEKIHKRSNSTVLQYKLSSNLTVPKLELAGFVNLTNTCYMNSVVQCFIRIPQISSFYFGNKYSQFINLNNSLSSHGQISNEFHNILIDIASQQYSKQSPYTLAKFRSAFVNQYNQFNSHDQQDAQEFLICLIDGLHEDINQAFKNNKDRKRILETFSPNESPWEVCKKINKSQIYNLFLGMTETKLTCQICSHIEKVQEPFVVLSLPLPPSGTNYAQLEDCLKRYCQKEILTKGEKIECTKCKKKTNANRVLKIERCGEILIIALKRFENSGNSTFKKNDINIIYPVILDMNQFSSVNIGKFKLIGCVYHYGSLEGGHYTAASLDQLRGKWYSFDDSSVGSILERNVHSRNAYILFYQKE